MKYFLAVLSLFALFGSTVPVMAENITAPTYRVNTQRTIKDRTAYVRNRILALRAYRLDKQQKQDQKTGANLQRSNRRTRSSYRGIRTRNSKNITVKSINKKTATSLRDRVKLRLRGQNTSASNTTVSTKKNNISVVSRRYTTTPKRVGSEVTYYESGNKKTEGRTNEAGQKIGTWTLWHDKSGVRQATEQYNNDGTAIGRWFQWYENGRKQSEMSYNDQGQKNGTWKEWYEDGGIKFEGRYRYDVKRDDFVWYYDRNKRERKKIEYNRYGDPVRETQWSENGKIAFKVKYEYGAGRVVRGGSMATYTQNGTLNRVVIIEEGMDLEALRAEMLSQ